MTIEEFNEQGWSGGMTAKMGKKYNGKTFPIAACDFEEALIGITGLVEGSDEINWVRCESVECVS